MRCPSILGIGRKILRRVGNRRPKQVRAHANQQKLRPYNWKLFSLTKTFNVEDFLYGRGNTNLEVDEPRAAYYKLWGTESLDDIRSIQPRGQRTFKPVKFTPDELVPEAVTATPNHKKHTIMEAAETLLLPPRKFEHISAQQPQKKHCANNQP